MNEPVMPSPEPDRSHGFEARDVNVWYVLAFAAGLALMVVGVLPLMDWTFQSMEQSAKRRDVPRSPLATGQEPPAPRLQSKPSASLADFRRREERELGSYRWIDKQQGVVQIPVDRAMKLLVERGLPEPKGAKERLPSEQDDRDQQGKTPAATRSGKKEKAQE